MAVSFSDQEKKSQEALLDICNRKLALEAPKVWRQISQTWLTAMSNLVGIPFTPLTKVFSLAILTRRFPPKCIPFDKDLVGTIVCEPCLCAPSARLLVYFAHAEYVLKPALKFPVAAGISIEAIRLAIERLEWLQGQPGMDCVMPEVQEHRYWENRAVER